jgi:hypothetical protein
LGGFAVYQRALRKRFYVQAIAGLVSASLAVITLLWHDWIELVFGVDPDHGSGAAEWLVVGGFATVALSLAISARAEWRRSVHVV